MPTAARPRSNEEWLDALRQDDGEATADLRDYLRRGLAKALASRRLRDGDLDDFVHDGVVQILRKLDTFRGDSRFGTWALAVAIRVALSTLRRRAYRARFEADDPDAVERAPAQQTPDPAGVAGTAELYGALDRAITESLTERQRAAVMGELEGVPTDVLATRLGITRNALYKLHHDARRRLLRALAEAGYGAAEVRSQLDAASKD